MLITGWVVDHYFGHASVQWLRGAVVDLGDDSAAPCAFVAAHQCCNNSSKVIGYWADELYSHHGIRCRSFLLLHTDPHCRRASVRFGDDVLFVSPD
jgi:hypothetical protein